MNKKAKTLPKPHRYLSSELGKFYPKDTAFLNTKGLGSKKVSWGGKKRATKTVLSTRSNEILQGD